MRTPEGWHKAWFKIRHCFKMSRTPKTRAHPGSELLFAPGFASRCARLLRRGSPVLAIICRPTLRRFAPSLRAQFPFLCCTGGCAATPLHHRLFSFAPVGASNSARWRSQTPFQLPIYRRECHRKGRGAPVLLQFTTGKGVNDSANTTKPHAEAENES